MTRGGGCHTLAHDTHEREDPATICHYECADRDGHVDECTHIDDDWTPPPPAQPPELDDWDTPDCPHCGRPTDAYETLCPACNAALDAIR